MAEGIYWGCTTFNCTRGFNGTEENMAPDWRFCPACGSELVKITTVRHSVPPLDGVTAQAWTRVNG